MENSKPRGMGTERDYCNYVRDPCFARVESDVCVYVCVRVCVCSTCTISNTHTHTHTHTHTPVHYTNTVNLMCVCVFNLHRASSALPWA